MVIGISCLFFSELKEDKDAMDDFRELWKYLLSTGVSVGAFKLADDDTLLELAGVNVLFVATEEINKYLEEFTVTCIFCSIEFFCKVTFQSLREILHTFLA